jgi:hypothetical protein
VCSPSGYDHQARRQIDQVTIIDNIRAAVESDEETRNPAQGLKEAFGSGAIGYSEVERVLVTDKESNYVVSIGSQI